MHTHKCGKQTCLGLLTQNCMSSLLKHMSATLNHMLARFRSSSLQVVFLIAKKKKEKQLSVVK